MSATLSQHPRPDFSLLHLSDTHLLGGSRKLHGLIETEARLDALFQRVIDANIDVRALVFTGDLADRAEPDAYRKLKGLVEPRAESLGAEIIWVMGNHDEREPFSDVLWGKKAQGEPLDRVYDIDGLRIIALDSSVPGYHHGELRAHQHEWLAAELSTPAQRGTLLAIHHPPIPTLIDLMGLIELADQDQLWSTIAGSDVRGILAGHLHYSTHSVHQAIPVSVAAAMCYNIDLVATPDRALSQVDTGHTLSLVSIYENQLVFSEIPATDSPELAAHSTETIPSIYRMSQDERRENFSRKDSAFNQGVDRQQLGE